MTKDDLLMVGLNFDINPPNALKTVGGDVEATLKGIYIAVSLL